VLSFVRGAIAAGMQNPIHLYFGVRSPQDIYGLAELQELQKNHSNVKLEIVVTTDNEENSGYRVGLITDVIAQDIPNFNDWRAYICGAPPMVEAAAVLVKQRGIQAEQVYADAFYASGT
jgi:ferredoxin-NAD(P)+ reductase (naphthalene dioxygenase ferredoxin-specific)